jgi:hypothetical protein
MPLVQAELFGYNVSELYTYLRFVLPRNRNPCFYFLYWSSSAIQQNVSIKTLAKVLRLKQPLHIDYPLFPVVPFVPLVPMNTT